MNLKGFHIVFITISVIFSFWLALFEYQTYSASKNIADLTVAVLSAVAGVGLLGYGTWFVQKIRRKAL